ncbi:LytR/AlgR family response regulator transcription factor [Psychrobacillus lasiicapitis]|uniref:Response regulator transcription factor n=1 Tax=Psychrobacillus lasiicapitis TaxID=1636719 RepID=A0A544T6W8_9BACI|nr:LytTR family DNA-binding domain-containing protein [Psychrobacillus lasiicapitis]TQR13190.1 response regulator transcription factor [Psychrobacillus lasiicapitis]GGA33697.1 DNA-binding response regulator [Psychrobacillus lasiicapitis]
MGPISALIVDDERYAREELAYLLGKFPSVQVFGEAESGEAAILKALQIQPDVVFLDVEMPKMNGIEVAKTLTELKKVPLFIFATAYPQFAVEAFRINAIDYLLKPYDERQLKQTVERIEKTLYPAKSVESTEKLGKLAIETGGDIDYILPQDILYIYRDDKVTKIITQTGDYDVRTTLKELESRLEPFSFFRIHKGYLVNLKYVSRLTPWFNGAYQLELDGVDQKLSVSRNYVKDLRQRLEL